MAGKEGAATASSAGQAAQGHSAGGMAICGNVSVCSFRWMLRITAATVNPQVQHNYTYMRTLGQEACCKASAVA